MFIQHKHPACAPQTQKRRGCAPLSSSRRRASTFSLKPWCSQAERKPACTWGQGVAKMAVSVA